MLGAAHHLCRGVVFNRLAALALLLRGQAGGSTLAAPFLRSARAALSPDDTAEAERRAKTGAAGCGAMIIGAAGDIDLGKTSLIKVLTGVDGDRVEGGKARGITIDFGFAECLSRAAEWSVSSTCRAMSALFTPR